MVQVGRWPRCSAEGHGFHTQVSLTGQSMITGHSEAGDGPKITVALGTCGQCVPYISPKHRHHAERVLGPKPSPGAEGTAVTGHLPPLAGSTGSAHSPGRRPAGGTAQGPQPARVSSDGGQGEAIWQRTLTLTRSRRFIQVCKRVGGRVRSEGGAGVRQADLLCLLGGSA